MPIKIGNYENFSLILLTMIRLLSILFICSFVTFSCKKEGCTDPQAENYNVNANTDDGNCTYALDELQIKINTSYGNQSFYLDSSYLTDEGYTVKFTDLKFYLSDLINGQDTLYKTSLYDYRNSQNRLFSTSGDYSKFGSLSGNIGLDSSINHDDPSMFPNDSPLNIGNAGLMHWGWNTGYIFISIEGKVDTLASGNNFNHNFSFHVGTDQFLDTFTFNGLLWSPTTDGYKLDWSLNLKTFLNNSQSPIDLKNEFLTHSGSGQLVLAEKVKNNFMMALTP
jgi:hypothetical protein